eukprot:GHVN01101943.1.p1 GENE.GHVN01101943.1~~GHVN01101943.1.p1  ORF type:complete len:452 (-),score=68.24 GHVN01101943.1:222-1556(-)
MKPQRIRMAHSLIVGYQLYKDMEVYRPHKAIEPELACFHEQDYVNFLSAIDPQNYKSLSMQLKRFNIGDATDCPVFDGLFEFQQSCAGASIDAARLLNNQDADICINWSGGLHHAKRSEASGFCYINDIVLGILELLKFHARVMYIDIDIHHGDGVEEAFFTTHRVMTVSFHKFGDFFPGTGDITDLGAQKGKYYSVNVPLNDGVDDASFIGLFKPIITKAVEVYQPGAIVLQCGADSITGDRLGRFDLSIKGHGECVSICKTFNVPLLILGGGGYTIRNVARCWAYETAVALERSDALVNEIPLNEYYHYYSPDYELHLKPIGAPNLNSAESLNHLKQKIFENLSRVEHSPGVQFAYLPPDYFSEREEDDEDECNQRHVDWEGGGLASGVTRTGTRPSRLRRRDYATEGDEGVGLDNDQRRNIGQYQVGSKALLSDFHRPPGE